MRALPAAPFGWAGAGAAPRALWGALPRERCLARSFRGVRGPRGCCARLCGRATAGVPGGLVGPCGCRGSLCGCRGWCPQALSGGRARALPRGSFRAGGLAGAARRVRWAVRRTQGLAGSLGRAAQRKSAGRVVAAGAAHGLVGGRGAAVARSVEALVTGGLLALRHARGCCPRAPRRSWTAEVAVHGLRSKSRPAEVAAHRLRNGHGPAEAAAQRLRRGCGPPKPSPPPATRQQRAGGWEDHVR